MRLLAALKKSVPVMMATLLLLSGSITSAETIKEKPSAGAMIIDAVLARPLYFVLSQGGALVYGATLPFTLLGGNADEAAEALVVTPLQAAFVRCLGCGKIDNAVGNLEEGEGKRIRHFAMLSAGISSYDETARSQTSDAASGGFYLGTHFALSDSSRFDVLLGYRTLGTQKIGTGAAQVEDSLSSIQISSRFGKRAFWGLDFMGKLGMHSWSADRKPAAGGSSFSGTGFLFGAGVEKFVTRDLRIGVEYTRYSLEDETYKATIGTADLNISYMF